MLKGVPDFEERENEEHWPALEEEHLPATERDDKQGVGKPKEKNMVVKQKIKNVRIMKAKEKNMAIKQKKVSRNLRGRPHKSTTFLTKSTQ